MNAGPKPYHIGVQFACRDQLPMWTVYRPTTKDFTGIWVARMHLTVPIHRPTDLLIAGSTLEEVRNQLPPGLKNIGRHENDDPVIEEVWI